MFATVAILSILSGLSLGRALTTRQEASRSQLQDLCDRRYSSSNEPQWLLTTDISTDTGSIYVAVVVGNKLYINGGQNLVNRTDSTLKYSSFDDIQYIDLSSAWNISSPLLTTESKPDTLTTVNEACSWSDGTNFYQYGGWQITVPSQEAFKVWELDTSSFKWTAVSPNSVSRLASGGYTDAPKIKKSYAFGGFQDQATTSDRWYSRQGKIAGADSRADMIEFSWETRTAKNITYTNKSNRILDILDNSLAYVPVGESGILIPISGRMSLTSSAYSKIADLSEINFFDIASSTWYSQAAVGAFTRNGIPESRVEACTVVQPAADNSSFNIYMFGGSYLDQEDAAYNDMWILSLPSFKWIKVENVAESGGEIAGERTSHTCQIIGKRQMAVIGGGRSTQAHEQCKTMSVFVFDVSTLTWRSSFNPSESDYILPKAITDVIGGDERGNADSKKNRPESWNDAATEAIFFGSGTTTSPTTQSSTQSSPTTPLSTQSSEGPPVGAIAGGVVGGLAALGVIGTLFIRRHRRNEPAATKTEAQELSPEMALHELSDQGHLPKDPINQVEHDPGSSSENLIYELDGNHHVGRPAVIPPNPAPPQPLCSEETVANS